jgi:hypothetical protein
MSIYPKAIDGFEQLPLVVDGVTKVNAFSVNNIREAVINIERELGIDPSSENYDSVSERLDALEAGQGADFTDIENRLTLLESQVASIESELGANPSGSFNTVEERLDFLEASSSAPLTLVTDSVLSQGDLVRINSSGNAELVDAFTLLPDQARVVGSSFSSYLIGETAQISSNPGKLISVRFSLPPSAVNNGDPVYLSTTSGLGTLTPPSSSNTVIFLIGVLQGANGISTTPNLVFQPSFVAYNS